LKNKPDIIVVTPIKNESWILDDFLRVTSSFADRIIVGDHFSTDRSIEIAQQYPKVVLFRTSQRAFSERERRNELLKEARKFGDNNVIISLDADEFLSPNFLSQANLDTLRSLPIGTRIKLPFFNVRPDLKKYWVVPQDPIGFVDDGSFHEHAKVIHFPRIPLDSARQIFELEGSGIIHLQYIDWARMESKHRWYRAWERVNFPQKSALDIQRRYSHMYSVPNKKLLRLPVDVLDFFEGLGVDFQSLQSDKGHYWWDDEVLQLIAKHGKSVFRYIDLEPLQTRAEVSLGDKLYWRYLSSTSKAYGLGKFSPFRLFVRVADIALRRFWP
jgi:glycosyltransferase involved in cell wall biosynthesis